jgi:uncharacterized RDD family membrane protein YckC
MEAASFSVASNGRRIWSFMIDDMVVNFFLMIIFYEPVSKLMSGITEVNEASVMVLNQFILDNIGVVLAVKVLYHAVLVWQSGMTLGKYLMKIKVLDLATGMPPGFIQAFWRASVRLVSEMFFYVGFLFAFFSSLHQTLHDKLSNCVVADA